MEEDVIVLEIDDDDERNAPFGLFGRSRPRRRHRPQSQGRPSRAVVVRGRDRAPVESREGGLRTGVLVAAAAEAFAAIQSLPPAPTATGEAQTDMENLFKYQDLLAQTWKRNQQIRTIGSLARAFMQ